jgi:hypothetical protein
MDSIKQDLRTACGVLGVLDDFARANRTKSSNCVSPIKLKLYFWQRSVAALPKIQPCLLK